MASMAEKDNMSVDLERGQLQADVMQELEEELRTQPLLDSVRSLVNKERHLAGLQLEEKEREAELWRKKYLQLQTETGGIYPDCELEDNNLARPLVDGSKQPGDIDDDWDNLQAACKKAGDCFLGKLRAQNSLDLSRRGISRKDLDGIVAKLRWLRGFISVDLGYNGIDDGCAPSLKNLMALRQLRRLDLRGNELGPSASKALLESLPRCKGLQVLRLEANVLFAGVPGAGALLATSLRAAVKAGGCRHLWSLSVTLDDFDGSFFMNAPRKTKQTVGSATTGPGRSSGKAAAPPATSRRAPAHPMNALAFARAFHPRAPGGGVGALLNENGGGGAASGDGGVREKQSKVKAGSSRGSITSLGLPYARLHHRTVEELATHAVSSLTHLDLSHCHVGAAGAFSLARALDGIGGSTANGVESGVGDSKVVGNSKASGNGNRGRGSHSLRSLNLPHNFVGDSGARALGRALVNNHCLTFLSLASNGIGSAGGRDLAAALDARGDSDGDGGDGGGALIRLDVGDNPLGENAARLLVAASNAAPSGIDRAGGQICGAASAVHILGLDRVAGASVATREAARRIVAPAITAAGVGLPKGGVMLAAAPTLVAIDEGISVQSDDAIGDDGLVQVYQVHLDSRFEPPADHHSIDGSNGRGRYSTLDIEWSFAPDTIPLGLCQWRVSRLRQSDPEFAVKEGIGTEQWLATSQANNDAAELRDGYSRIRIRCNGWRTNDLLKIFVRSPSGGSGCMKCCDLTICLVKSAPLTSTSPSSAKYGLLWADPKDIDEGLGRKGGWRKEDVSRRFFTWGTGSACLRPRSIAECAQIAFQMSHNPVVDRAEARSPPKMGGTSGIGSASTVYCLRQVHIAYGGRIRASWQSMLATTPYGKASTRGGSNRSLGGKGGEQRPLCGGDGYTWAIVRTRGELGDGGGGGDGATSGFNPSSRVIQQGSVSPGETLRTEKGGGDSQNSNTKVAVDPSCELSSSTVSPWRWHWFDVDTTAWLPGDSLSLWIRLDDVEGNMCSETAPAPVPVEAAVPRGEIGRDFELSRHPRVRGFELEVVDDAAAEDTARRSHCVLRRKRDHLGLASSSSNRLNGGRATATNPTCRGNSNRSVGFGEAAAECYFAPAFSATAARPGISIETVQLDFAACPMNMAAAGGSWA